MKRPNMIEKQILAIINLNLWNAPVVVREYLEGNKDLKEAALTVSYEAWEKAAEANNVAEIVWNKAWNTAWSGRATESAKTLWNIEANSAIAWATAEATLWTIKATIGAITNAEVATITKAIETAKSAYNAATAWEASKEIIK